MLATVQSRKFLGLLVLAILLAPPSNGCAGYHHRERVRQGMLMRGLSRDAFEDVWGLPTRTYTITGDEITQAGWGATQTVGGGFFFKGKQAFDVWEYAGRGVTLVFDGGSLVAWKTDKTVEELREKH